MSSADLWLPSCGSCFNVSLPVGNGFPNFSKDVLPCDLYSTAKVHLQMGLWDPNSNCRKSEMNENGPSASGTYRPVVGGRCLGGMSGAVWCQDNGDSCHLLSIYYVLHLA